MRIAINTRLLLKDKLDGIGWFTSHISRIMAEKNPDVEFIFIFDRPWDSSFIQSKNIQPVSIGPPARHPLLYIAWFEYSLPKLINRLKPDLLLNPDGFASLSVDIPQVSVIHDLNFEHYPKDLPFLYRHYYQHYFPKFAKKVNRIGTVSNFSKSDIIKQYQITADKIDVVYNGVNPSYKPIDNEKKMLVCKNISSGMKYFLFVGMLHPRKNISNMLKAYDRFRNETQLGYKLVIVGNKKWWTDEISETYKKMAFKDDVIFLGRIPIEQLNEVMAAAHCMLYVSTFEGFGVPIIESMKCGVPVITSNVTSMPEISGGSALLTDPFDVSSISMAMKKISADDKLWKKLSSEGLHLSAQYSWEKTTRLLWDSLMKVF